MEAQEPVSAADFAGGAAAADSDAWLAESGAEVEAELQRAQAAAEAAPEAGAAAGAQELDQLSTRLQVD